jgi:hypothetical protein
MAALDPAINGSAPTASMSRRGHATVPRGKPLREAAREPASETGQASPLTTLRPEPPFVEPGGPIHNGTLSSHQEKPLWDAARGPSSETHAHPRFGRYGQSAADRRKAGETAPTGKPNLTRVRPAPFRNVASDRAHDNPGAIGSLRGDKRLASLRGFAAREPELQGLCI